jgi:hypothetical protein
MENTSPVVPNYVPEQATTVPATAASEAADGPSAQGPAAVEISTPDAPSPKDRGGRPKQYANATERKRAQRARDREKREAAPAKGNQRKIHGTAATKARAYRTRKAIQERRSYHAKIAPPAEGSGTQSDWNRYLKSIGLGTTAGLIVTDAPSHCGMLRYSGSSQDVTRIDEARQFATQAEGYPARPTRPAGASPSDDAVAPDSYDERGEEGDG